MSISKNDMDFLILKKAYFSNKTKLKFVTFFLLILFNSLFLFLNFNFETVFTSFLIFLLVIFFAFFMGFLGYMDGEDLFNLFLNNYNKNSTIEDIKKDIIKLEYEKCDFIDLMKNISLISSFFISIELSIIFKDNLTSIQFEKVLSFIEKICLSYFSSQSASSTLIILLKFIIIIFIFIFFSFCYKLGKCLALQKILENNLIKPNK